MKQWKFLKNQENFSLCKCPTPDDFLLLEKKYQIELCDNRVVVTSISSGKSYRIRLTQPVDLTYKQTVYRIAASYVQQWAENFSDKIGLIQFMLLKMSLRRMHRKVSVEELSKYMNSGLDKKSELV